MRIVDRKTFLAMPAGTVFAKYAPCYFEALAIKGDTWGDDFLVQWIADAIECTGSSDFDARLFHAQEFGDSLPMDLNSAGRDGCFDMDQLFAVFESADVVGLIVRLQEALAQSAAAEIGRSM